MRSSAVISLVACGVALLGACGSERAAEEPGRGPTGATSAIADDAVCPTVDAAIDDRYLVEPVGSTEHSCDLRSPDGSARFTVRADPGTESDLEAVCKRWGAPVTRERCTVDGEAGEEPARYASYLRKHEQVLEIEATVADARLHRLLPATLASVEAELASGAAAG